MATVAEIRVHVVVLWEGDVVHATLLAPRQSFVLGDGRNAWPCPASALGGARSHVLVRVSRHTAQFTPPGRPVVNLACGQHASAKLGRLTILASAGVVDGDAQHFRTTRWDKRLVTATALTALAHAALLSLAAYATPPLAHDALLEPRQEVVQQDGLSLVSFAEPELQEPQPDLAQEPSAWLTIVDGWARCGDEFEMGIPTPLVNGYLATTGPKDNADPHLARENGPARPALNELSDLPPAKPTEPPPEEHRDAYTLTLPWGRETPLGTDDSNARAPYFGDAPSDSWGEGPDGKIRAPGGRAKLLQVADAPANAPSAPQLPPRVVHTGLRVAGALEPAHVSKAMLTQLPTFRACYAASLSDASKPDRLELVLAIAPDGTVTRRSASHADSVGPAVVSCMLQAAQALLFDAAPTETTVTYPLLLIPPAPSLG